MYGVCGPIALCDVIAQSSRKIYLKTGPFQKPFLEVHTQMHCVSEESRVINSLLKHEPAKQIQIHFPSLQVIKR